MSEQPHHVRRGCCGRCDDMDLKFAIVYASATLMKESLPIIAELTPWLLPLAEATVDAFAWRPDLGDEYLDIS